VYPGYWQLVIKGAGLVALDGYGVLVGQAVDRRREGSAGTPHYQIRVTDGAVEYRIAVNAKSQQVPSDLLYLVEDDLRHPVTDVLAGLDSGWHPLGHPPGGGAAGPNLDYVRGNLFDPAQLRPLPPDVDGPDNDLADLLDHYVQSAIADPAARLYAFGQRWGPEPALPDKIFQFSPGNGVHDIHMNQGNTGRFREDDGVWQDGGLLIHLPARSRWVGIFLAFQSQAWHTDDNTGHARPDSPPRPDRSAAAVRILAALVSPAGPAGQPQTVLLLNASPGPVDLTGWRLTDRHHHACPLPAGPLPAGTPLSVPLSNGLRLGDNGGTITVLDSTGAKVSGVTYTADQARPDGWTITF
jgi:uncharacterized protein YukJ